jgi:hypothetical protein
LDIMVDFETLATDTKCTVLSIGLVAFDYRSIVEELYIVFNSTEQEKMGRTASQSTKDWWTKQASEASKVLSESTSCTRPVKEDLERVVKFISKYGDKVKVWGNGSGFDINILEDLLVQYKIPIPWKFWNIRDLRTFVDFIGNDYKLPANPTGHNALSDSKWQASYVIRKMNAGTKI